MGSPLCVTSLNEGILDALEREGYQIARIPLGSAEAFSSDLEKLIAAADRGLAGNQGRYRYAKALELGAHADAVLHCVPRYENTAVVLELSGLSEQCPAPLFELSLDGDWDESAWARLRSFLYYC